MTEIAIPMEQPTADEIALHYSAALDSVNLIMAGKPENMLDSDWADCLVRNKSHLNIMLAKPWWTTQNLEPLQQAAA